MTMLSLTVAVPDSWIQTVCCDLHDLAQVSSKLGSMRDATIAQWVSLVKQGPKVFIELCVGALKLPEVNTSGLWWPETKALPHPRSISADPEYQTCPDCGYTCATVQGMNWHMHEVHSKKHELRWLFGSSICLACMYNFHSRERLFKHLSASSDRCRQTVLLYPCGAY